MKTIITLILTLLCTVVYSQDEEIIMIPVNGTEGTYYSNEKHMGKYSVEYTTPEQMMVTYLNGDISFVYFCRRGYESLNSSKTAFLFQTRWDVVRTIIMDREKDFDSIQILEAKPVSHFRISEYGRHEHLPFTTQMLIVHLVTGRQVRCLK